MKPERWQQLDELFHAAVQRTPVERAAFLDKACAGDELLRKQVEALLSAHEEAESFIESPALDVEARALAMEHNESLVGETIGHYKIISSIGVGGMGEVYLAQDTHLGRKVALKLLPAEFTRDADRVRRFQQEARAASALNHPNIVTIHEIGQAAERQFIATEFIEGETLRQRISSSQARAVPDKSRHAAGGIQLSEVLNVGMQVADALAAAHAKGIVHRDIKPENIILVEDSHLQQKESFVKVLDFGIAKLTEPQASGSARGEATTRVLLNTHEGSVMGTAGYMSPEQARGEKVDGRTDIWSLGIVLYEMLTNTPPFGGETAQDVIASILKEDPPAIALEVPDRLRWIVEKALRKNREERYQTAREMFSDLRDLQRSEHQLTPEKQNTASAGSGAGGQNRGDTIKQRSTQTQDTAAHTTSSAQYLLSEVKRHRGIAIVVLTALVIGVAGIAFGLYKLGGQRRSQTNQNQSQPAVPFQTMKIVRLTSTGQAALAAISPDGKYVVHVVNDGEQQSLWMRQVSTSSNVQISPPADISYFGLTFSPTGDHLYYNVSDKKNPFTLYQMPVLGGAPRKLITDIDSLVSFSPDRKQFAFLRGSPTGGDFAVMVANADGSGERKLATSRMGQGILGGAAWSRDGKVIVYPGYIEGSNSRTLLAVKVSDGSQQPISSERWSRIGRIAWMADGSGLVFTARETVASPSQIWYLSYPDGQVHRITNDLNDYLGVSLTADSAALVTVESDQVSNIWVASAGARRATQVTHSKIDGAQGISWTPDGKIIYVSGTSGKLDLWMMEANGTGQKQLTADAGNNRQPSVSADGRHIVFVSDRTGTDHVWRIDIDGSNARQLTDGDGESNPQCSPTGNWVIYQTGTGKPHLWKVSIDGGECVQIVDKASSGVAISPDGKWIASALYEPANKTAIYPIEGGEPHQILDISSFKVRWSPDGRALTYVDSDQNLFSNLRSRTIDGGPPKLLTNFTSDGIFSFAWSQDGKQLALARGTRTYDVVLISEFKDQK